MSIKEPGRRLRSEYQRFKSSLAPGHYRLSADFVGSRVDRRIVGLGWGTREGFPEGTRFTIREAVWTYEDRPLPQQDTRWELCPVFLRTSYEVSGWRSVGEDHITWVSPIAEDVGRLLGMLVLDTSDTTWLDHAVHREAGMPGCFDEVLLELLVSGRVSREEIAEIVREKYAKAAAEEQEGRREIRAKRDASADGPEFHTRCNP